MTNKTKVVVSTIGVFFLVVATIGVTYAIFNYSKEGATTNVVTVGNLKFLYTEVSGVGNGIQITDALPMSDTEGKAQSGEGKVFDFKVEAKTPGTASIPYEVTVVKTDSSTLDENIVKLYLTEADGTEVETEFTKTGTKYNELVDTEVVSAKGKTIYQGEVPANASNYLKNFKLRMWLDESTDFSNGNYNGKTFTVKVNVYANAGGSPIYVDKSGAHTPELASNMIPVTYNEETGNWEKANLRSAWYDYDKHQWANAVVVKENGTKTRDEYQSAEYGTEIDMEDILQMLVWIPRYKYAIGEKEGPIAIKFEDKNTTKSTGTATGDSYLTHPGFTFGDVESNGFWFSKFETSSDSNCTPVSASAGTACDLLTIHPLIKPNQRNWTGVRLSTFHTVTQDMKAEGNIYGYDATEIDPRVMRNADWGAVAYLTQSIYGRCEGSSCEEVTINNLNIGDLRTITGCAGDTVSAAMVTSATCPVTNQYNTEKGVKASTTGNIYGIYDMSGGDPETVTAVYGRTSGITLQANSGYTGPNLDGSTTNGVAWPEDKYFTFFTTASSATACNGSVCYGQALSETTSWNGDDSGFVKLTGPWPTATGPWITRGGSYEDGTLAGIFASHAGYGSSWPNNTSRVVVNVEQIK